MPDWKVVALHFTRECNLTCPFCYRPKDLASNQKPLQFFIDCVPYVKKIAPQIALGGGEPFLFPGFISTLGDACKQNSVILNVTTNGTLLRGMKTAQLHQAVKDVTLVSVSLDHAKWPDLAPYASATRRLKSANPDLLIGTNLLLEPSLFEDKGKPLYTTIDWCIKMASIDRVFLLYPKNIPLGIDILQYKDLLSAISTVFPDRIYTDDLARQVLDHGYPPWPVPCHHGKDIISINEEGGVHGCSFDSIPALKMTDPSDLAKIKDIAFETRMSCPYLKR